MVLPIAISIRLNSDSQILRESEKLSLDPFRTEGIRLPCNFRPLSSSCPVPVPFFYLSLTDLGRGIKHLMGFFFVTPIAKRTAMIDFRLTAKLFISSERREEQFNLSQMETSLPFIKVYLH